jgi:hypothetical protein
LTRVTLLVAALQLDWRRFLVVIESASFFPKEPQVEIDGVHASLVWVEGRPIAVINAWDIAIGRGWMEKAEDWAREHCALLYDSEGGFDQAVLAAFGRGCGIVVVRQFSVRD